MRELSWRIIACGLSLVSLAATIARAQSYSETVLHAFTGTGSDGYAEDPSASLVRDRAGNLFGTTVAGGTYGWGVAFEIGTSGVLTIIHSFAGAPSDGSQPQSGLVLDSEGNLYGVTPFGGSGACSSGCGTVFKLDAAGREHVLYSFTGEPDGSSPDCLLLRDTAGNLYGTTQLGGTYNYGAVFKLNPAGQETVLYSFTGGIDGANPNAGLVEDAEGNLYGTTYFGGKHNDGTVFELNTGGQEVVLHSFGLSPDGSLPEGPLTWGAHGLLYGTTSQGGTASCAYGGCGTVFEVSTTGVGRVIYNFTGGRNDGASPSNALLADYAGNLYGTTVTGGNICIPGGNVYGAGTVFRIDTSGLEAVIHFFGCSPDGTNPDGGLVRDNNKGNFYGTTFAGGDASCPTNGFTGCGTVFQLSPQ